MFEAVGHAVSRLIRIRYGAMVLPRGLKRGGWMELDELDIRALMQASGGRAATVDSGGTDGEASDAAPRSAPRDGRPRRGRTGGPRGANAGQRNTPAGGSVGGGAGRSAGRTGGGRQDPARSGRDNSAQPDPMKTAFGYIGADSFTRQRQEQGPGQRPRGNKGGPRRNDRNR
jgi:23S rRNA pseudouridine2605 synthase